MNYKAGDVVWYFGIKCKVGKVFGFSELTDDQILSIIIGGMETTEKSSYLKPVIRCYAVMGV